MKKLPVSMLDVFNSVRELLAKPGDSFNARITDNERVVFKIDKGNEGKYTMTQYKNGTTVHTLTTHSNSKE
ncbi:MAG: hypothetical protein K2H89_10300 [Oscillospiraceae bacterium]|nr:hypothetical protein [Oscillospiraceae bacterium]